MCVLLIECAGCDDYCRLVTAKDKPAIQITLPSGDVQEGTAFVTTPMDVAKKISDGLAQSVIISKVLNAPAYSCPVIIFN